MTDEERVVDFKQKLDKVMKSYFWTELLVDFVVIAIGVIAMIFVQKMNNETALMVVALLVFVLIFSASFVLIKIFFGSLSGMSRINSFRTRASFIIKNLDDCKKKHSTGKISSDDLAIAQTIYNDEIANLVLEIDNIKPKK